MALWEIVMPFASLSLPGLDLPLEARLCRPGGDRPAPLEVLECEK